MSKTKTRVLAFSLPVFIGLVVAAVAFPSHRLPLLLGGFGVLGLAWVVETIGSNKGATSGGKKRRDIRLDFRGVLSGGEIAFFDNARGDESRVLQVNSTEIEVAVLGFSDELGFCVSRVEINVGDPQTERIDISVDSGYLVIADGGVLNSLPVDEIENTVKQMFEDSSRLPVRQLSGDRLILVVASGEGDGQYELQGQHNKLVVDFLESRRNP